MTPSQLAHLLGAFDIIPTNIKIADGRVAKGYHLRAFSDVLSQYPRPDAATPLQDPETKDSFTENAATAQNLVAANIS